MSFSKTHRPILLITALTFESRVILNHHNISTKPEKLTTYRLENSLYLLEAPMGLRPHRGLKTDTSALNRQIREIAPKLIVNFGICGALDRGIPIGAPRLIEQVCCYENELLKMKLPKIIDAFEPAHLLTVDKPVLNASRRDELFAATGCQLVDMEALLIARLCQEQNLPLLIVKISSDLADENSLDLIKANRSNLRRWLTRAYEELMLAIESAIRDL